MTTVSEAERPSRIRPPKPHLTLRVAITGHRPKSHKFPASSFDFVQQRLRDVFAVIDTTLAAIVKHDGDKYSGEPPTVRLVSGLAEGADQMAVEAMRDKWTLEAILPFPHESYADDFKQSASDGHRDVSEAFESASKKASTTVAFPDDPLIRQEHLTRDENPSEYWRRRTPGYIRLGRFLLRQTDVLVAVWDGEREEGPAGTAEVVRAAVDAGIPIVWISSINNTVARMVEDIDDDERPVAPDADCLRGSLARAIHSLVSLPTGNDGAVLFKSSKEGPPACERLHAFLKEQWPQPSSWITYDLFKRCIEGASLRFRIMPDTFESYRARWEDMAREIPPAGDLPQRILEVVVPRYAWADALAVDLSNRYRAAYFNCYLLAASAVFIALLGLFGHDYAPELQLTLKFVLVSIELILIGTIVYIIWRGRRERWHEKWLEYRALAEMLWEVRFLSYLGEYGRVQRIGDLQPAPTRWFLWYFYATVREIGLPNALLDGAYQKSMLEFFSKHVVANQIKWNERNAETLLRMHDWLHRAGAACFLLTCVILVFFFVGWGLYAVGMLMDGKNLGDIVGVGGTAILIENVKQPGTMSPIETLGLWLFALKNWVTFGAALLPTFGAAFAGIRDTADFMRFANRSRETAAALQDLQRDVAHAKRKLSLDVTGNVLLSTAQVLSEDLTAWQSVYGHKRLDLPA
jgi:hypothetical protein